MLFLLDVAIRARRVLQSPIHNLSLRCASQRAMCTLVHIALVRVLFNVCLMCDKNKYANC